jgi:hypothetical protein
MLIRVSSPPWPGVRRAGLPRLSPALTPGPGAPQAPRLIQYGLIRQHSEAAEAAGYVPASDIGAAGGSDVRDAPGGSEVGSAAARARAGQGRGLPRFGSGPLAWPCSRTRWADRDTLQGSAARRRRIPHSGMRSTVEAGGIGPNKIVSTLRHSKEMSPYRR